MNTARHECLKTTVSIAANGGWVTRRVASRPRTRFFGFLSVVWLFAAIPASLSLWDGWPQSFDQLKWLCAVLLLLQPLWIVLAVVFWLTEKPRLISKLQPNPNYDPRKLY